MLRETACALLLGALAYGGAAMVLPFVPAVAGARLMAKGKKVVNAAKIPCFEAGTPVATPDGPVPIEDIQVGDLVLSRDPQTGQQGYQAVTQTFVTEDRPLLSLTVAGPDDEPSTLQTTAEHPFWTRQHGWTRADWLVPGDELFTSAGGWLRLSGSTWADRTATVYNLEVSDYHTYFAGDVELWAHNNPCAEAQKRVGRTFDQARKEAFERAGLTDPSKVRITKYDEATGTAVEFRGPGGAKVGYDSPHASPGPHHDVQHLSWQSAGKRGSGGGQRGNIPYEGPRHPSRSGRK